jgi:hypothetical protein
VALPVVLAVRLIVVPDKEAVTGEEPLPLMLLASLLATELAVSPCPYVADICGEPLTVTQTVPESYVVLPAVVYQTVILIKSIKAYTVPSGAKFWAEMATPKLLAFISE